MSVAYVVSIKFSPFLDNRLYIHTYIHCTSPESWQVRPILYNWGLSCEATVEFTFYLVYFLWEEQKKFLLTLSFLFFIFSPFWVVCLFLFFYLIHFSGSSDQQLFSGPDSFWCFLSIHLLVVSLSILLLL